MAQEVRTANFYDIEDDSLYRRLCESDEESQEDSEGGSSDCGYEIVVSVSDEEGAAWADGDDAMTAPVQPSIQVDDRVGDGDTSHFSMPNLSTLLIQEGSH